MPVTTRTKRWLLSGPLALAITFALPMPALAHGLFDAHLLDRAPLLLTALLVAAAWLLYLLGGRKVPPRRHEALCFHAAMLLVVFSVFGPIDDWAEISTAWHMTQHMLFIMVIAPLWALARPLPQWRGITGRFAQPLWTGILRAGRVDLPDRRRLDRLALADPHVAAAEHASRCPGYLRLSQA